MSLHLSCASVGISGSRSKRVWAWAVRGYGHRQRAIREYRPTLVLCEHRNWQQQKQEGTGMGMYEWWQ